MPRVWLHLLQRLACVGIGLALAVAMFGSEAELGLPEARRGFKTKLLRQEAVGQIPERPPAGVLELVTYPAPLGNNVAYLSPRPADGRKYPAVIWLFGGFSNSVGSYAWRPAPRSNDQSGAGFRAADIVMMYPSYRGGNDNPGYFEAFYGEVDDVLAAAKSLARLDYVDASRIYLVGHSTGGTLALLVAAADSRRFRAVFALGPTDDVLRYGENQMPFDLENPKETELRNPSRWLAAIRCPTWVIEGEIRANSEALHALRKANKNPNIQFVSLRNDTHFSYVAPLVDRLARAIVADTDPAKTFVLPPK